MNRASLAAAADARASSTPSEATAARKDRERRGATARGRSPDDEAPTPESARIRVRRAMGKMAHFTAVDSSLALRPSLPQRLDQRRVPRLLRRQVPVPHQEIDDHHRAVGLELVRARHGLHEPGNRRTTRTTRPRHPRRRVEIRRQLQVVTEQHVALAAPDVVGVISDDPHGFGRLGQFPGYRRLFPRTPSPRTRRARCRKGARRRRGGRASPATWAWSSTVWRPTAGGCRRVPPCTR